MSVVELIAVIVTLGAVYLTTRQIIWCWPLGLVSVTMYAVIFFDVKLYADMGLQGIYFLLSLYGWWAWLHGGQDHEELAVSVASWRTRVGAVVSGTAVAGVLGLILSRFTDASLPFMDSSLAAFSLVAQFMATRKLIESWLVWIAVDVLYVGMFIYKDLYLTAGLYGAFLILACMGLIEWRRSMAAEGQVRSREGVG